MPSFDIVSEVDIHEVSNAVDQANREVGTRFDFKGADAKYERDETVITLVAQSDFQLKQMLDILRTRLSRRGIDVLCMQVDEPQLSHREARQITRLRRGIGQDLARSIVRQIKDSKLKVQAAIQGEKIRVSGKKRDDLQSVIQMLKKAEFELPLQYENFRD
jgi:cyclic-di-GMP-binding protein